MGLMADEELDMSIQKKVNGDLAEGSSSVSAKYSQDSKEPQYDGAQ